jgi:hypothetical protein
VNILVFVISLALFIGGFFVMGNAFYVPGAEYFVFLAGIIMCCLGFAIPVHLLKRIDS